MYIGLVGLVRRQHSGNQNSPDQGLGQEPGAGPGPHSPSYGRHSSVRGDDNGVGNGTGNGSSIFAGLGTNHHRRGLLSSIGTYTAAIPLRYYPLFSVPFPIPFYHPLFDYIIIALSFTFHHPSVSLKHTTVCYPSFLFTLFR